MSKQNKTVKASFSLHPETWELLSGLSDYMKIPKSSVISLALDEFYANREFAKVYPGLAEMREAEKKQGK